MSRRRKGQPIFGLLLLDKPRGLSSNQAMQRAKRALDAQKAGHGGSLDPMADGLLPVFFGDATRLCQLLLDGNKAYRFCMQFGHSTTTGDAEGELLDATDAPLPTAEAIASVLPGLLGEQQQVPPMYSALKKDGQPLYKLARQGQVVAREARTIQVHELVLEKVETDRAWLRTRVSKGTYIRTLAEEIAKRLRHKAHLCELRRTACGPLQEPGITLEALELAAPDERRGFLRRVEPLLPDWPVVQLSEAEIALFRQGRCQLIAATKTWPLAREGFVHDASGRLCGLARATPAGLQPVRVFAADQWAP